MPDDHDADDLDPGNVANTQPPDARPFVVALVGFVIVATLAFFFLRENDADLELVRPDALQRVEDNAVETTIEVDHCGALERAQVDQTDDDIVFVEIVVQRNVEPCSMSFDVTVVLPEPIDGRRVVGGVGRRELPCDSSGRCEAEQ